MTIPNYDLGILITLNVSLTMIGLLIAVIGIWAIMRQNIRSQEIMLEVARISQRIDARLRRDFPDIGGELRD
jgi:hypothetical protein